MYRKYSIDPLQNPYNSLDFKLTLSNKSRIEVYRNEQLVATQELQAGVYDLRNLPIAGFSGDLKIKIVDVSTAWKKLCRCHIQLIPQF